MDILIAEDDNVSRKILEAILKKWSYNVISCKNGEESWQELQKPTAPQLAILDWMMPEMDGIDVCRYLRQANQSRYTYIILLTGKGHSEDIVTGLEAGADDYLTKPFDKEELQARIHVGERVISLENQLKTQITLVTQANQKMERDLNSAAKVQTSLLPSVVPHTDHFEFNWFYEPSDQLGGDMINVFQCDDDHIVCYILDVSGHGIQAALLSVTIRNQLSIGAYETIQTADGKISSPLSDPISVLIQLNRHYCNLMDQTDQYFTLLYGVLNIKNRTFKYVQCGHPAPIMIPERDNFLDSEKRIPPLGMYDLSDLHFEINEIQLVPGESLFLYTDGMVEEQSPQKEEIGEERFIEALKEYRNSGRNIHSLIQFVKDWSKKEICSDDLSVLEIHATKS